MVRTYRVVAGDGDDHSVVLLKGVGNVGWFGRLRSEASRQQLTPSLGGLSRGQSASLILATMERFEVLGQEMGAAIKAA